MTIYLLNVIYCAETVCPVYYIFFAVTICLVAYIILIYENIKIFIVLVDQEDNSNQSRSFEGEDDLNVGRNCKTCVKCNICFKVVNTFSSVAIPKLLNTR